MPHVNITLPEGVLDPYRFKEENVIDRCRKICDQAKLPLGRVLEVISIINLIYGGCQFRPKGLMGVEFRALGWRYADKPHYRIQWKYITGHNRSFRIFIQQNRDHTYVAQMYIRSKDVLTEVTGSTWQELSLHLYMMLDQLTILEAQAAPRRVLDEKRHHPQGYRKV